MPPPITVGAAVVWQAADASLTRPGNATPYAANQGIGASGSCLFKFTGLFRNAGGTGLLTGFRVTASVASIATTNMGNIRAYLFNQLPTGLPAADQAAFNTLVANSPGLLGHVDFSTWTIGGASSDVITAYGAPAVTPMPVSGASNTSDGWCVLASTAAFTPIAAAIITPSVSIALD